MIFFEGFFQGIKALRRRSPLLERGSVDQRAALGAFAGISLGKDLKDFAKMGWKLVLITLFVITGTFIFSALVADIVLKMTGAI